MNIENPILKNSKWLLTFQLAVVAYSIYLVHYAVNSFEFTRMEPLIFSFRDVPLWDFFRWDIGPIEVKFKDYGPILPAIVRWVYPLTGADISLLRWVPGVFFILNTILIVFLWQEERPDWVGALVALLLLSNRYFVYFNTLLAPYSLAFFLTFVTLLLVRKALKADASLGIQALASIFGLLALLNHYTSVLLVVPALAWMFWQKGKDSRILGSISGVAFLSVLIGKGVQIFQIRYQVLRTPEAVGQLDWAHYLGSLLQFFGSFSRQFSLSYALIALLTVGLFAFGNRQGGAGEFIQRLFRGYLVVAILSYLFFNLLGMHEIEARYYLYALPFVYTVLASNLMNSVWLRGVTVALCVLQFVVYQQHRNENYRPQMTATKFFIDNLQAGDQICSPDQVRYALKVRNTLKLVLEMEQIKQQPIDDYFGCYQSYRDQTPLQAETVWIYGQRPYELKTKCSEFVEKQDCASDYFAKNLASYSVKERRQIEVARHSPLYITKLVRRVGNKVDGPKAKLSQ